MSIALTPFAHGPLVFGHVWTVADQDELADQVAQVALGQSVHVERILAGATPALVRSSSAAQGALALLTADANDPSHRDGWLFQVMSWIAACRAAPTSLMRAPHMTHAQKGFDGLELVIDSASRRVTAAIIFEDKATVNPRDTMRDEVWPQVRALETGAKDNVLMSEVSTLLRTHPDLDPVAAVEQVVWKDVRRYRVSVTVSTTHATERGRKRLFKGYDAVAPGALDRRQGCTFEALHLRNWMGELAEKAKVAVRKRVQSSV